MTLKGIDPAPPSWLAGRGEFSECVLSSRVRIARNLKNFPFARKADRATQERIAGLIEETLEPTDWFNRGTFIGPAGLTPLFCRFLLERHLVSPDFEAARHPRGLFVDRDQNLSVMVNEEDHLRCQALASGLAFEPVFDRVNDLDTEFERRLDFAFSDELGFLTACPTNVGTALRASVLIHLPALVLSREIEKVLRGVMQVGYSVRGLYGEGSETRGHFFQVSNQTTLGVSESEIILGLAKACRELVRLEHQGREFLHTRARVEIEDKVFRARAVLENARVLSSEEVINLTSAVRLGIGLGLVSDLDYATVNEIMILSQPAHIQVYAGRDMEPAERDEQRADFIRNRLQSRKETR